MIKTIDFNALRSTGVMTPSHGSDVPDYWRMTSSKLRAELQRRSLRQAGWHSKGELIKRLEQADAIDRENREVAAAMLREKLQAEVPTPASINEEKAVNQTNRDGWEWSSQWWTTTWSSWEESSWEGSSWGWTKASTPSVKPCAPTPNDRKVVSKSQRSQRSWSEERRLRKEEDRSFGCYNMELSVLNKSLPVHPRGSKASHRIIIADSTASPCSQTATASQATASATPSFMASAGCLQATASQASASAAIGVTQSRRNTQSDGEDATHNRTAKRVSFDPITKTSHYRI